MDGEHGDTDSEAASLLYPCGCVQANRVGHIHTQAWTNPATSHSSPYEVKRPLWKHGKGAGKKDMQLEGGRLRWDSLCPLTSSWNPI